MVYTVVAVLWKPPLWVAGLYAGLSAIMFLAYALVLGNLGVHHCKPVKAWLAEHKRDIEVFFLPSYSPELNPDERHNADLKHTIGSKVPVRTKAKLRAAADQHMQFVATNRERVRAYFQDPLVKYAA